MGHKYLYKILDQPLAEPLPEMMPATDLDAKDGFIHLSTGEQTPITARLFFNDCKTLWILKLERRVLDGRIEYSTDPNAGIENGCAHVHDNQRGLGKGNIVEVVNVHRKADEDWTEAEDMMALVANQ